MPRELSREQSVFVQKYQVARQPLNIFLVKKLFKVFTMSNAWFYTPILKKSPLTVLSKYFLNVTSYFPLKYRGKNVFPKLSFPV